MIQIAATIYLNSMKVMKKTLDLIAFRLDKRTKEFKYAKEEIMNYTYNGLKETFKLLEKTQLIEKCSCGTNVRCGYKQCICKGSGYKNLQKDK